MDTELQDFRYPFTNLPFILVSFYEIVFGDVTKTQFKDD